MGLKKISLTLTDGEWDALQSKLVEMNKKDFGTYLRSEIPKVGTKFEECPECITPADGSKKQKGFFLTENSYTTIKLIAKKKQKSMASVIEDFFVTPLLIHP